jgi:hypothetical protein
MKANRRPRYEREQHATDRAAPACSASVPLSRRRTPSGGLFDPQAARPPAPFLTASLASLQMDAASATN